MTMTTMRKHHPYEELVEMKEIIEKAIPELKGYVIFRSDTDAEPVHAELQREVSREIEQQLWELVGVEVVNKPCHIYLVW